MITLRIDLNAVRGNRLVTFLSLNETTMAGPGDLDPGAVLKLIDEEGDSYLGTIGARTDDRLELAVDFDSLQPAMSIDLDPPTQPSSMDLMEALRQSIVGDPTSKEEKTSVPNVRVPSISHAA